MRTKVLSIAAASLCIALALGSCSQKQPSKIMTMLCDNSFENIMEEEIDVFEYAYLKQQYHVLTRYVTQKDALDSLFAGSIHTIIVGRDLTKTERKALKDKYPNLRSMKIAVDAVALIVNPSNPVDQLSMKEISEILAGSTTNWSQLQPGAPDKRIHVYFDSEGSGLAMYMRDTLLNGRPMGPLAHAVGSIDSVLTLVQKDPAAMGVIGVSHLTRDLTLNNLTTEERVQRIVSDTLAVNGEDINNRMDKSGVKTLGVMRYEAIPYKPYQQNIYDGSYPLTRPMYMITTASPAGVGGKFYAFVTGVDGQRIIMKTGIMPARMQITVVEIQ